MPNKTIRKPIPDYNSDTPPVAEEQKKEPTESQEYDHDLKLDVNASEIVALVDGGATEFADSTIGYGKIAELMSYDEENDRHKLRFEDGEIRDYHANLKGLKLGEGPLSFTIGFISSVKLFYRGKKRQEEFVAKGHGLKNFKEDFVSIIIKKCRDNNLPFDNDLIIQKAGADLAVKYYKLFNEPLPE
jgi:hypothetical protein